MNKLENAVLDIVGDDPIPFELIEKKLIKRFTKGEIRNMIWRLAHNGNIVIGSDYGVKIR